MLDADQTGPNKAGVLLHPTSLPSGKLDDDAWRWIDWLEEAGFSVWQVLPLGVPQHNHSPYMCLSSFAINPALMPVEELAEITQGVDLAELLYWHQQQRHWIDDYALFMALKEHHAGQAWHEWPIPYRQRDEKTLLAARYNHRQAIKATVLEQYALHTRWQLIRDYANNKGISTFGDLPIFVALDSADVWANQACFLLDEHSQPSFVAGVPPDYFSATGQRWGNPQYDWEALQANHFDYWIKRLRHHLQSFDLLRIDHFRGLDAVWMIPADSEGAIEGHWQAVPGKALLNQAGIELEELPLVAENLGTITAEVEALREHFHLPGMAVLHFAWDGSTDNPHLPKNIRQDNVVYTGTHDNDTTRGWFESLDDEVQKQIMARLGIDDANQIGATLIEAALGCAAQLAILPLQDLLGLGSSARMNTPGTDEGNWGWKFDWDDINSSLAPHLKQLLLAHHRCENAAPVQRLVANR